MSQQHEARPCALVSNIKDDVNPLDLERIMPKYPNLWTSGSHRERQCGLEPLMSNFHRWQFLRQRNWRQENSSKNMKPSAPMF